MNEQALSALALRSRETLGERVDRLVCPYGRPSASLRDTPTDRASLVPVGTQDGHPESAISRRQASASVAVTGAIPYEASR